MRLLLSAAACGLPPQPLTRESEHQHGQAGDDGIRSFIRPVYTSVRGRSQFEQPHVPEGIDLDMRHARGVPEVRQ